MSCKVNYIAEVRKDLKNLPPDVAQRIILSINGIRDTLYHSCPRRSKGRNAHPLYTNRVGEYRAIIDITEDRLLIMVMETDYR